MWPFDFFRSRRYQRAFDAAVVVLLATHMFEHMDLAEQARVDSEVDELLKGTTIPAAAHRLNAPWDVRALFRAIAMEKLGIEPPLPDSNWKTLMRHWKHIPINFYLDFHPYDHPTWDAQKFLLEQGIELSHKQTTSSTYRKNLKK